METNASIFGNLLALLLWQLLHLRNDQLKWMGDIIFG